MKKSGKNIEKARKAVEPRPYTLQEAVPLLQKVKFAKFDETVEVTLRLITTFSGQKERTWLSSHCRFAVGSEISITTTLAR